MGENLQVWQELLLLSRNERFKYLFRLFRYMVKLVDRFRDTFLFPTTYINIDEVVENNKRQGLRETGGEFILDESLSFFDIPNESLKTIDEVMKGDYKNIQKLIKSANDLRTYFRIDMGDDTDSLDLGTLIGMLILLREGKKCMELGITPTSFFKPYQKLFSATYNTANNLRFPDSYGFYHTHPFGLSKGKPSRRDLLTEFPSIVLEFDIEKFNGIVNLHFIDPQKSVYSFKLDINKKQYEEK